jgi:DNA-directed RNA polymerase subunit RPC12/RpoP
MRCPHCNTDMTVLTEYYTPDVVCEHCGYRRPKGAD